MANDATTHTIEIKKEETRIINVIKVVNDIKNVKESVSFIINDIPLPNLIQNS